MVVSKPEARGKLCFDRVCSRHHFWYAQTTQHCARDFGALGACRRLQQAGLLEASGLRKGPPRNNCQKFQSSGRGRILVSSQRTAVQSNCRELELEQQGLGQGQASLEPAFLLKLAAAFCGRTQHPPPPQNTSSRQHSSCCEGADICCPSFRVKEKSSHFNTGGFFAPRYLFLDLLPSYA